jgi:hypothetical protein
MVQSMSSIPDDLDALLTRDRTAAALAESGYPTSPKTLATMATRGGGPRFHRFGPRVLYRWRDALGWAEKRLSPAMRSTSEADAA